MPKSVRTVVIAALLAIGAATTTHTTTAAGQRQNVATIQAADSVTPACGNCWSPS